MSRTPSRARRRAAFRRRARRERWNDGPVTDNCNRGEAPAGVDDCGKSFAKREEGSELWGGVDAPPRRAEGLNDPEPIAAAEADIALKLRLVGKTTSGCGDG